MPCLASCTPLNRHFRKLQRHLDFAAGANMQHRNAFKNQSTCKNCENGFIRLKIRRADEFLHVRAVLVDFKPMGATQISHPLAFHPLLSSQASHVKRPLCSLQSKPTASNLLAGITGMAGIFNSCFGDALRR